MKNYRGPCELSCQAKKCDHGVVKNMVAKCLECDNCKVVILSLKAETLAKGKAKKVRSKNGL